MKKKKKGGKRMTANKLAEKIESFFRSHPQKSYSFKEIFKNLKLDTHPLKMLAIDLMEEMAWDDFLTPVADNAYRLNLETHVQEGKFIRKNNGKNVFIPDGSDLSVFVAERNSMFALSGDRVKAMLLARKEGDMREAIITDIISHDKDTFVGKIKVESDIAFLITEANIFPQDVIIPKKKLNGARDGEKAVVKIINFPSKESKKIIGEVVDVLGESGNNDVEMNTILAQYGLPYKYPKEVEEAAECISGEITAKDLEEREDFRDIFTCTIDPKDAKDFDDALSLNVLPNGHYQVGVHIADVSHYVKEGDIIDKEAQKRATSVYLVDRTIPMLPERLCNFICSLRPNEEKLAYSVIFEMDDMAHIYKSRVVHTVIKSDRRYAYEEVQTLLENNGVIANTDEPAPIKYPKDYVGENAEALITLDRLAKMLRKERFSNGAVRFDREELHFDIDEKGHPVRCYFKVSKDANKLIEEFMLLANRTVAEKIGKVSKGKKAKTLPYRIHDNPDPQRLEALKEFVTKLGYKLKTDGTKGEVARSLNKLIDNSASEANNKMIQTIALRAMMKAKYSVHNIGHFGLAFPYYTHFTSPIRRYPDTLVHRLLTAYAEGAKSANKEYYESLCEHSSEMELIAQNAERDSIKFKMVEFMNDYIGERFDAHISGITSFGMYCEIDENHCEGMVPMRELDDDYYDFDEKNYCLVGRRRGKVYRLGDAVKIEVTKANIEKRLLDFSLV
jgi:ribonuclease R